MAPPLKIPTIGEDLGETRLLRFPLLEKTLEGPALEGSPGRYRPGNFLHLFRHASQAVSAIGVTIAINDLLA